MKKMCIITTTEVTMNSFILPAMDMFVDKGYDVTLVCSMSDSFMKNNSGKYHCVNFQMKRGIALRDLVLFPFRFWHLFRREHFDFIQYATTNASFYAALPALLCGIKTRLYCQWGLLYVGYDGIKRTLFKWVEKYLCWAATHVTVASKKNMELAIAEKILPESKASVLGDGGTIGVDLSVFDHSLRDEYRRQVFNEYPILIRKTVFGYVGRIEKDKGISELIRAFLTLNNESYALLLVGGFDELRCDLGDQIVNGIKDCDHIIHIDFTHEVAKYMSVIDVLVHPTYREGFSMVIQQAMAMGCAVITTDIPGPSEIIQDGISGVLVPVHSVPQLAGAMKLLGDNSFLRSRYSAAGLERVSLLFNRKRMLNLTFEDRVRMMND